jgi:hypothetical protein
VILVGGIFTLIEHGGIVDHSRFLTFRRRRFLGQLQELGPEVWRNVRSHRILFMKMDCVRIDALNCVGFATRLLLKLLGRGKTILCLVHWLDAEAKFSVAVLRD